MKEEGERLEGDFIDDSKPNQVLPCNTNSIALYLICASLLLIAVSGILQHLIRIKKRSQLKRLVPFLFACTIISTACVYKMIKLNANLGEDFFLTLVFAFIFWDHIFVERIFVNKFLAYQYKTLQIKTTPYAKLIDRLKIMLNACVVFGFIG